MNAEYVAIIKEIIPRTKIIIDYLHIVRSMKFT